MKIESIECIPVTVPIEAPVLTCYGSLSAYARSVIRIRTDNGLVGWGETAGRVRPETIRAFEPVLQGLSPWDTTLVCERIRNWSYYPYQKPEPVMAGIEMACLDLQGKAAGVPLVQLLGGRVNRRVRVASYLFFRHANAQGHGRIHTPDEVTAFARAQIGRYGFDTVKLKGGYFSPETDRDCLEALRDTFGRDLKLRIDPQGAWTPATAARIGADVDRTGLEYYEDPVWGTAAMAQVRSRVRTPLATNMCVTSFDEFRPAIDAGAVDVVLADLWYWGGIRATLQLDRLCAASGIDVGMHSSCELGIGWAAIVHTACAMPHLKLAIDNMNLHVTDDIIVGGKLEPTDGEIAPPDGPGLGIEVDESKLEQYAALANSGTASDRLVNPAFADSERRGWFPKMPAW